MAIDWQQTNGIVTLSMNHPRRSINVIDDLFLDALKTAVSRLESEHELHGVILTSAKPVWLAGADLNNLLVNQDPAYHFQQAEMIKALFRRLETLSVPVVAAVNGTALGGGLELALACHHRISLNDPRIQLGFPEIGLGLLPGLGGISRTVRLIGLEKGLEWLTHNKTYSPTQALGAGIIHDLATDEADLLRQARARAAGSRFAAAPWDAPGRFQIPGGGPDSPKIAQMLSITPARIRQETRGQFPAPHAILAAAVEGARVDFPTACRIESRYFARLAASPAARNMVNTFWFNLNGIKRGLYRPDRFPMTRMAKIGVIGAGKSGIDIVYSAAKAGLEVILLDASVEKMSSAIGDIKQRLQNARERGRLNSAARDALMKRITGTTDPDMLAECELVIEAVTEDRTLKDKVLKLAAAAAPDAIIASTTVLQPLATLAAAVPDPTRFIGMHFFSPVEKTKLVEIAGWAAATPEIIARAYDFVRDLGKVPIVVRDGRGYYTTRVFSRWLLEGAALLAEGQHPAAIEMAGLTAGMPAGPLAQLDNLSLSLLHSLHRETVRDLSARGMPPPPHPAEGVIKKMMAANRDGRAAGAGFYDYHEGGKQLWTGLPQEFPHDQPPLPQQELIDRILYVQAIETVHCAAAGVINSAAEANIGSIFGWGFPAFHGGTIQFIHAVGPDRFARRAQELADQFGPRFQPPDNFGSIIAGMQ